MSRGASTGDHSALGLVHACSAPAAKAIRIIARFMDLTPLFKLEARGPDQTRTVSAGRCGCLLLRLRAVDVAIEQLPLVARRAESIRRQLQGRRVGDRSHDVGRHDDDELALVAQESVVTEQWPQNRHVTEPGKFL